MFLNINNKKNITFSGMMGSGKSTVGKLFASKIKFKLIDIDKLIEKKTQKSISKIFLEDGEQYFRELEEKITIDTLNLQRVVVSLGGGSIMNSKVRKYIKSNSFNIYLKVKYETLLNRLLNSKNRPLLDNKNLKKNLNDLLTKRKKYYEKADLIIKNENFANQTVENILTKIRI